MSRYRLPTRLTVLATLCGLVLTCGEREEVVEEAPAAIGMAATTLPQGASVVVSGEDVRGFWTHLKATQLYAEMAEIEGVREAFAPLAESRLEFEEETGLPLDEETMMSIFGDRFDMGYYGPLPQDRADMSLVAAIADQAQVETILEALEQRVETEEDATFREFDVGGATVRVATTPEKGDVLFYTVEEGQMTMATTETRMTETLAVATGGTPPMSDDERYLDVIAKVADSAIVIYVDQDAIEQAAKMAAAESGDPREEERLRLATSALETYRLSDAAGIGLRWVDNGIQADIYGRFPDDPRSGLVEMWSRPPAPTETLAHHPTNTVLFAAINVLDAGIVYDELYRYAVDVTRMQIDAQTRADSMRADSLVAGALGTMESETGISLENDLVPWVGDEGSLAITGVDRTGFFPVPEVAITLETTDEDASQAFMTKVEALLSEIAAARASIPVQWQSEAYEGATIRYAPTPLGEGLSLSYSIGEGFVLIASSRGLLKRMLDAEAGRAEALPADPNYLEIAPFYPDSTGTLSFVDIERILNEVQSVTETYSQMSGQTSAAADSTSTTGQVLAALGNASRLGFYSRADDEGLYAYLLLLIR